MEVRALFRIASAALALAAFALSSCIDYEERLELDKDFGGRLTGTIGIPEMLASAGEGAQGGSGAFSREKFDEELEGIDGVEVESAEEFKEAGKRYLRFTIAFDSIDRLSSIGSGAGSNADDAEGVGDFLGEIRIDKDSRKWTFERTVTLQKPSAGDDGEEGESNALAEGMLENLLGNNFFTYEVRFPSKVLSANVREFDEENNTVTWKYSLSQLAKEPAVMRAEIFPPPRRLGTFLWLLVAIGALAVIAAGGLYVVFRLRTA